MEDPWAVAEAQEVILLLEQAEKSLKLLYRPGREAACFRPAIVSLLGYARLSRARHAAALYAPMS